jgi:hypothetical protein
MDRRAVCLGLVLGVAACGPGGAGESTTSDTTTDTSATSSESGDEAGTETGDELGCVLGLRIDLCCNQPFPATPAQIDADPCVVAWPVDWASLPGDLVDTCVTAQPEWCQVVDCDYAAPASEVVEPDGEGGCEYVCPTDTYLAYRDPGCGEPPPVVECLGVPPPCADEYCSCTGETIYGCGQVGEPFEHIGPCE